MTLTGFPLKVRHAGMVLLLSAFTAGAANPNRAIAIDNLLPVDQKMVFYRPWYGPLLQRHLLVTPANCARMLVIPSGEGEYAISVYSKKSHGSETFHATYIEANQNLWCEREYRKSPDAFYGGRKPVKVMRVDSIIPNSTALAVNRAWKEMLSQVRPVTIPAAVENFYIDPTDVIFSVMERHKHPLQGQLWYKTGKHATALWNLGRLLISYCKADAGHQAKNASQIERSANRFVAELKKTPK